jgi:hypothetical protein
MFTSRIGCFLALSLVGGMAFAEAEEQLENTPPLPSASAQEPGAEADKKPAKKSNRNQEIRARVAEWLKTCLADWDRATHMTKVEWRTTCERVASERGKFLIDNPTVGGGFLGYNPPPAQKSAPR